MDCQKRYPETEQLHCGNWISYAYQMDLIFRIVMVDTEDYRHLRDFDETLAENADLCISSMSAPLPPGFIHLYETIYISVDTDIPAVPSDGKRSPQLGNRIKTSHMGKHK